MLKGHRLIQVAAMVVAGFSLLFNGGQAAGFAAAFESPDPWMVALYASAAVHALLAFLVLNHSTPALTPVEQAARTAARLRILALAGWSSVVLLAAQALPGIFIAAPRNIVLGCSPFVATAAVCGLLHRRLAGTPLSRRRKWGLVLVTVASLAYGFAEMFELSGDDWAALAVKRIKGPVHITVVNATDAMHEVEVGASGFTCHISCLKPGKRGHCEPTFLGPSLLFARLPQAGFLEYSKVPFEDLPVPVLWRSHGTVEVYVTDAGFIVDGGFSTDLF